MRLNGMCLKEKATYRLASKMALLQEYSFIHTFWFNLVYLFGLLVQY